MPDEGFRKILGKMDYAANAPPDSDPVPFRKSDRPFLKNEELIELLGIFR